MKRVRDLEIDLPWQMQVVILGLSTALSTLAVVLGWLTLGSTINEVTQGIGSDAGDALRSFFSFANLWPWLIVVLLVTAVRLYFFIKKALMRRLELFCA